MQTNNALSYSMYNVMENVVWKLNFTLEVVLLYYYGRKIIFVSGKSKPILPMFSSFFCMDKIKCESKYMEIEIILSIFYDFVCERLVIMILRTHLYVFAVTDRSATAGKIATFYFFKFIAKRCRMFIRNGITKWPTIQIHPNFHFNLSCIVSSGLKKSFGLLNQ